MAKFRTVLFWCHLTAGVTVGLVIFIMSVTGVLLMYERQLIEWSDRAYQSAPQPERPPFGVLLDRIRANRDGESPTMITLRADAAAPALVAFGSSTVYVDAYSGEILGAPTTAVRRGMAILRAWHRWLSIEAAGPSRDTAKAITGWSNILFLFIVLSGMYLWLPRAWEWARFRAVLVFRRGLGGKARDFNWHNVIGIWSAIPLALIVATAAPISFPWANALVYRLAGEAPPAPAAAPNTATTAAGQPRGTQPGAAQPTVDVPNIEALSKLWAQAEMQVEGWRSISLRLPASTNAPFVFGIDRGNGGQPQARDVLTLDVAGNVVRWEPFNSQSPGRRLRSWSRFIHTGEAFGLVGQTIAGLASAGGAMLVFTGISLALRRFFNWIAYSRRSEASTALNRTEAA